MGNDLISGHVPVANLFTMKLPPSRTYYENENLEFILSHPFTVTVTGAPRLVIDVGGTLVYANYASGSGTTNLLFRYTITPGRSDTDGISVDPTLDLNGGSVRCPQSDVPTSLSLPDSSGIKVQTIGPFVQNISSPTPTTYTLGIGIDFVVTYSEAVTIAGNPQLVLDVGGSTKYASYLSGTGTSMVTYRYTVESGLNDKNGIEARSHILNAGTIRDTDGNPATLTISPSTFASVFVDSRGPQILSITPPGSGVKVSGNTLSFTVNFDENVSVTGVPTLSLDIGGVTLPASYVSGSGTSALLFSTAVLDATHFDPEGISYSTGTLALNSGTLKDSHAYDGALTFTPGDISGIKVIYSEVISWLDVSTSAALNGAAITTLTDRSPSGNSATANSGTVTKISTDAGLNNKPSADFDGFSSLVMSAQSVKTIIVAFRSSTVPSNAKLVAGATRGIVLVNQTDMDFGANARYAINAGVLTGGVSSSCSACYDSGTIKIITVNYNANQNIAAFLGDGFDGRIAEVWLLSGAQNLTNAQIEKIGAYLNSRY